MSTTTQPASHGPQADPEDDYCLDCHNLGFVIMGNNDEEHPEVQACDCGHFASDEDAGAALDEFIRKHAPKVRRRPLTARNGSEIIPSTAPPSAPIAGALR